MTRTVPPVGSRTTPLPTWPSYGREEIDAVARVLASGHVNYWTGLEGRAFEDEFAASVGCAHGVAVANGTVALEIALRAVGVRPGDEVIVPARTFIATASAVVAVGARPVVCDVEVDSHCLSPSTVAPLLSPRTRAVIAVHHAGWPADTDALLALLEPRGVLLVEDCAQAHGAALRGRPVGSLGHVAAWSFCQDKIVSTGGEGGMVTTGSRSVWEAAWSYKDHGKSHQRMHSTPDPQLVHESFGSNARMTEMQAALGRIALAQLPGWVEQRRRNAEVLHEALRDVPGVSFALPPVGFAHSWYTCHVLIDPAGLRAGQDRDTVVAALRGLGVPCKPGRSQIHLEPAFPADWRPRRRLAGAALLSERSLVLPVHPTLEESHMHEIGKAVRDVLEQAS